MVGRVAVEVRTVFYGCVRRMRRCRVGAGGCVCVADVRGGPVVGDGRWAMGDVEKRLGDGADVYLGRSRLSAPGGDYRVGRSRLSGFRWRLSAGLICIKTHGQRAVATFSIRWGLLWCNYH